MSTVNRYEIVVIVGSSSGSRYDQREQVITEYAYSPSDALYQASVTLSHVLRSNEKFEKFVKIGPPAELIEIAAFEASRLVSEALERMKEHRTP